MKLLERLHRTSKYAEFEDKEWWAWNVLGGCARITYSYNAWFAHCSATVWRLTVHLSWGRQP